MLPLKNFGSKTSASGLKEGRLPMLNNVELNTLEAFNGFRYCLRLHSKWRSH